MSPKMHPTHRQRAAYVSLRQSSGPQVRSPQEGQRRQDALAERARPLGCAAVVTSNEA